MEAADRNRAESEAKRKRGEEEAARAERESILRSGDPIRIAAAGLKMPDQGGPEYDLREVGGKLYYVPKQPMAQGSPQGNTPTQDASFDILSQAVKWQESRGNPNAVSPKGAVGTMQTMPGTLRDPGYGVDPARDNSPQELERVGVDYLRAMTGKYGLEGGLAAYNWGPGNWERALNAAGGDPSRALALAPEETRKYVPSVLQRAQGGNLYPKAQESQRRRDLWELQQAGVPLTNGMAANYMRDGQFPVGAIPVPGIPDQPANRDAPSGYRFNDAGNLEPIPGGPADRKQNPVASDLAKGEMGMRKELDDKIKQDRTVMGMYRNIENATKDATAAGDLSAIFAFMKMLDPGSVVREQEFANAQNAAGVPDRIRNWYNQAMKGNRLNPTQRKEFLGEAGKLAAAAQDRISQATREYQGMADEYGYDPRRSTGMPDFRNVITTGLGGSEIDALVSKYVGAK